MFPPLAGMELGTARSVDKRFTHCAMGLLSLQKSLAESPGNDHEDAGEVRELNENMAQTTCIRAATCISRKILGCKMKALASLHVIASCLQ